MTRRSIRRLAAAALFAPLLFQTVAVAGNAVAAPTQAGPSLGGYTIDSRATGLRVGYDVPGSLPIGPLVDAGAPEAQARLATGPVGNAMSSLAYPGSLLLGLGSLLAASGQEPPAGLPDYPILVEASSSGPTEVSNEVAPGSVMYARAEQNTVEANTALAGTGVDDVLSFGGSRSRALGTATDTADGGVEVAMSEIVGLGGLLRIEAVVTTLAASSDGATATSTGQTTVVGATFAGQPITIGPDGVVFDDPADDPADDTEPTGGLFGGLGPAIDPVSLLLTQIVDQTGSLNEALAQTGISIRLAEPRVVEAGATAERVSEGMVIEFDQEFGDSELASVFDLIPLLPDIPGAPLGPNDFVQLIQARQLASIAIAAGGVAVSASPPFELPTFGFNPLPGSPTDAPSVVPTPTATPSAGTVGNSSPASSAAIVDEVVNAAPLAVRLPDLPAALGPIGVLLAVLGALLLALGGRRLPDWAIDGNRIVDACDLEPQEGDPR